MKTFFDSALVGICLMLGLLVTVHAASPRAQSSNLIQVGAALGPAPARTSIATAGSEEREVGHSISLDQASVINQEPWQMGTIEALGSAQVRGVDPATVCWSSDCGALTATLSRKQTPLSISFQNLTPRLQLSSGLRVTRVNGACTSPVVGERFEIELSNGQSWSLSFSNWLTLSWTARGLAASAPFSGNLRAAPLPNASGESR